MSRAEKSVLEISRAQMADVPALNRLIQSAFRGDSSRVGWTTEADILDGQRTDPDHLQDLLSDPNKVLFKGMAERELISCVVLEKRTAETAYLGMLTVKPTLQNAGLGKLILRYCEQWARENWNAKNLEMTVFSIRPELINWYVRNGYQKTGEIRPFPMKDVRLGIPKVSHLEFVVLAKVL